MPEDYLCIFHNASWPRRQYTWYRTSMQLCRFLACRSLLCCYVAWSPRAVSWFTALSGQAALAYHRAALLLSWIEVNCMRSAAVGKAASLSSYWQDAACRWVILAASGACAVEQISPSKRECGEQQASLKAALLTVHTKKYNLPVCAANQDASWDICKWSIMRT